MWRIVCMASIGIALLVTGCDRPSADRVPDSGKLQVICTLFPLYDWARIIGGEQAEVTMLLPPGSEAHSYAPKPSDVVAIHQADLFIYTGPFMEPWVADILRGLSEKEATVVNTGKGLTLLGGAEDDGHDHHDHDHHDHGAVDPHVWLDLGNAQAMVTTIAEGFAAADPPNAALYRQRAEDYKAELERLDNRFREVLPTCDQQTIMYGGHFPFQYFVKRYGLEHVSPYRGFSPDAEPTPRELSRMVETMKEAGIKYLFHGELVDPKVARVIGKETGAELLLLHAAHNVSRQEFEAGVSFLQLMEQNVEALRQGLSCP